MEKELPAQVAKARREQNLPALQAMGRNGGKATARKRQLLHDLKEVEAARHAEETQPWEERRDDLLSDP